MVVEEETCVMVFFIFASLQSPLGCMYNLMARTVCVGDHKASA